MQIKYFQTAWNDIRNSEGWFGKLCLLALVGLIPIFGPIVVGGYLYGWAREMAWGVHEPMPAKIFGNEDGKLYRRGWFILVMTFVFSLIPSIIVSVGSSLQGMGTYALMSQDYGAGVSASVTVGGGLYYLGLLLAVFVSILTWVASMRISIYDKLSAGFQLGKIWKMMRQDAGGIMRIFGMNLLVGLIVGIVLFLLFTVLIVVVLFAGIGGVMSAGYSVESLQYMTDAQATRFLVQFIASAGVVGVVCLLLGVYVASVSSVFLEMLVARAMGYWTWQFDVPHWRGQSDPLPFEKVAQCPTAQTQPPAAQASAQYSAAQAQPYQQEVPVQQPAVEESAAPQMAAAPLSQDISQDEPAASQMVDPLPPEVDSASEPQE